MNLPAPTSCAEPKRWFYFVLAAVLASSCASPTAGPPIEPPSNSMAPPQSAPSSEPSMSPSPLPSASADNEPSSSASTACPADMVLVEGDYCEDLEVICDKKFHAPQNHLWVCEKVKKPTRCIGDTTPKRYCIDRYEFPNRKGERPMVMQNFYQAQVHCANRGKRICTESEWTLACEGPDRAPFPYGDGYTRDATQCHGDQAYKFPNKTKVTNRDPAELERLWQGRPSGSQPACVSAFGVHDMNGNADELAASETHSASAKSNFDNVTTGGPWYHGVRNMCRPKIYSHDESFAYYYLSWRCCAEPDGLPVDPRAPKQVKRNWDFDKVRYLAEHSWKLPFNPLEPGDPGYNAAGPDR